MANFEYTSTVLTHGFMGRKSEELDRKELERAFIHAPNWASDRDRGSVRKWPDIAAFLRSNSIVKLERVRTAAA